MEIISLIIPTRIRWPTSSWRRQFLNRFLYTGNLRTICPCPSWALADCSPDSSRSGGQGAADWRNLTYLNNVNLFKSFLNFLMELWIFGIDPRLPKSTAAWLVNWAERKKVLQLAHRHPIIGPGNDSGISGNCLNATLSKPELDSIWCWSIREFPE